jgi:ABC-type antimicrobial peptide transport system permease subunit
LISSLGLFGLALFTAERRTKEIGIRKVMGASVVQLTLMLGADFIRLVVIGLVIGYPIAWYFTNEYIEGYSYHPEIGPGLYILTGSFMVLIASLSVGYQSIKAAASNPVNSLRVDG